MGRYSKIVKTNVNNKPSPIRKISKYEYLDTRDDEIKQYNLDKPTSIKDVKKKLRRYEELVLYNFAGGRWHIHLFIKYPDNKVLYIPRNELSSLWGHGIVHVFQNLNTVQTLGHSAGKREEKLERLKSFPKGEPMYKRSKGIQTPPKQKLQFQECPESYSDEYRQLSRKTYLVQNVETDKIINATTTAMYKHVSTPNNQAPNEITSNSNVNVTNHSPTITSNDHDTKVKQMIERQNDPNNTWYWEFI